MRNETGGTMVVDLQTDPYNNNNHHRHNLNLDTNGHNKPIRPKFGDILKADHDGIFPPDEPSLIVNTSLTHHRFSSVSASSTMSSVSGVASGDGSPCVMSPWARLSPAWGADFDKDNVLETNGLIGSIVREEGHIYSLAASGDLLYTGSDSKNIRVWKNLKDYAGFKSSSGLIKAIVIFADRIFTGHQDGKIRIWKVSKRKPGKHKRVGTLPTFKSVVKSSVNPKHFMDVRRNRNSVKTKHNDAVSSLSLDVEFGLLYSSSWDTTIKVWRIADSKCLESIHAHDDAINSIMSGGFDDLVFTGSADGTVKVWKREMQGKGTKHALIQVLLKQENAVTALAVKSKSSVVYSGSSDGLVNYWERSKRIFIGGTLKGHKSAVLCLATAGNLLLSGSADKNICVWRREPSDGTHQCLSVLTGHMGPVKCLAVEEERACRKGAKANNATAAEGERTWIIYSGSLDKSVKVWRVSERMATWREMDEPAASSERKSSSSPHEGGGAWNPRSSSSPHEGGGPWNPHSSSSLREVGGAWNPHSSSSPHEGSGAWNSHSSSSPHEGGGAWNSHSSSSPHEGGGAWNPRRSSSRHEGGGAWNPHSSSSPYEEGGAWNPQSSSSLHEGGGAWNPHSSSSPHERGGAWNSRDLVK